MEINLDLSACNNNAALGEKQNVEDKCFLNNYQDMIVVNDINSCNQQALLSSENVPKSYTILTNDFCIAIAFESGKNELLDNNRNGNDECLQGKNEGEPDVKLPTDTSNKLLENNSLNNNKEKRYELRKRKDSFTDCCNTHAFGTDVKQITNVGKCYSCPTCLEKFNDESSFNTHWINLCQYRNSKFSTKNTFSFQTDTCNNQLESMEKCLKCYTSFLTHSGMQYHMCSKDKIIFKCDKCNKIFSDENELEAHLLEKQCRNMEVFTCDTCKSTFTNFDFLKKHIAEHLRKPLHCLICNQCFASQILLKNHYCSLAKSENNIINKHDVRSSVQKCSYCNKSFRYKHHCKKPIQLQGSHKKNCRSFTRKFTEKSKFTEPSRNFKKVRKPKFKCDNCGKDFVRLSKLHIHIMNTHNDITHECEKCNLKFMNQEERDIHLKDCKGEEPCSCKICGKLFAKKDYLKKHEYIHSNALYRCKFCHCAFMKERSYRKHVEKMNCSKSARKIKLNEFNYKKCRICNRDFNEEEMLSQHFHAEHPGQNPHQCFCCESCLPTFRDLENHIHLHNIQKYTCGLCGKPYTSQEGFRKHRLKHKGAELKCQFCDSEFLNEGRFKFHVKTCKKNPESAYHNVQHKGMQEKKDDRPKQSRQLHWESRIIMKRLRGDPNSGNNKLQTDQLRSSDAITNFFDERDSDSNDSNVRGWFDDYYKTEEDDFAFGLKRDNTDKSSEIVSEIQKYQVQDITKTNNKTRTYVSDGNGPDSNENSSNSASNDTSSEEEDFPDELPLDYNPKKCRVCLVTFSQEYELLHHFIKLHPKKKAHKCPKCNEECPLFAQLKEHMKTHGIGMGIYNCVNCSKRFRNEKKMKTHMIRCKGLDTEAALEEDSNKKNWLEDAEDYCRRCCKTFQTKCGYRRHKHVCKERHKSNKENKKTTDGTSGYTSSEAVTMPENDSPPSPQKQTLDAASPLQSKTNVVNTSDSNSKTYAGEPPIDSFPCRLCDKKFQYERGIVMHFKSDHPGHKPLVCHICNMHLADKLKEHLKTHGIGEEFICELCGKRFNQKFLSKIHEMWHQGVEYKCGNCKQKFLNKEKMDKHVSEGRCSNRQSLMKLPCDICGKSYRSKFGLSKHYITHTPKELRPVKNRMNCEFCGKWFETNNGLQRHRRIHTGERPFCCRFCSKSFVQEGNCKSHERIHTGEPRPRKKKKVNWEGFTTCS